MIDNNWRIYIIKGILDALNDIDNGDEVGAFYTYVIDYDEALWNPQNIIDKDLNAVWNYADYTLYFYEHKDDGWEKMVSKLRDVVEKIETNQPITDPEILKYADVRLKENDFLENSKISCLLLILCSFIICFLRIKW